jgi:hypothetical protein
MIRIPRPSGPDPAEVEWSRVMTHSEKLLEALEALGEAGGVCRVAAQARWSPERHDAALCRLQAIVELVETEAGRLELRRRHFGARRRRLG